MCCVFQENVEGILLLSHKYDLKKAFAWCKSFLESHVICDLTWEVSTRTHVLKYLDVVAPKQYMMEDLYGKVLARAGQVLLQGILARKPGYMCRDCHLKEESETRRVLGCCLEYSALNPPIQINTVVMDVLRLLHSISINRLNYINVCYTSRCTACKKQLPVQYNPGGKWYLW
jgi:hypothetical protein